MVYKMRTLPISSNIDECTARNQERVYSTLVSYVDCEEEECVVQNYKSVELIVNMDSTNCVVL